MVRPFPPNQLRPPLDAVWIGAPHPFDLHEVYLNFRAPTWRWDGAGEVKLFITADSRYRLWVNGRFVNRGPARSYPQAQKVDVLNLNNHLLRGDNALAVQVYQPGYSHFSYVHRGAAGLLAWLMVDEEVVLVSNGRWQVQRDGSFAGNVPRVSIYGSGAERRDWGQTYAWQTESVRAKDGWSAARVVDAGEGAIWYGLQRRETPQLVERDAPLTLVDYRRGVATIRDTDVHVALREGWQTAASQPLPSVDEGRFSVALAANHAYYWLFDLGRAYTCQGWVEIAGAAGGEQLAISYADKMRDGELVISDPSTYCRVRLTDSFQLRPSGQTIVPFHLRGGRYVLFQLIGTEECAVQFRPHIRIAEYPLTVNKPLQTDDELLDSVVTMCEDTLRACLQETFVDCVWRESSQWLGDALPQGLTLLAMSDDVRPLRTVLLDTADGIYPDGILPSVAPAEVHAYTIPRYNCMWVELLAHYFAYSQDSRMLHYLWPTLKQVLAALLTHQNELGLLTHPAGRRFYIDWSPTAQNDPHLVYNLHVVLALQTAAELAATFEPALQVKWQENANRLKAVCREAYWQNGRWWDDLGRTTYSQLGGAMALLVDAVPVAEVEPLLDKIIGRSLDERDEYTAGEMVLASPFMHHYLFEALRKYGREAAVVEIIRQRWGRWAKDGYPTTWENWNVDFPDGSQCHAFSAHPRYHLAKVFKL